MRYFLKISLILIVAMIILAPNGMAGGTSASASGSASASASGAQASSSASASGGGESDSTSSQSSGSSASSTSGATASDSGVTVRSESSPSISNNDDSSDDSNDNGNNNIEDTSTIYDETEIGVVDCNSAILSDDPNERCKKIKISIRAEDNTDASGVAITIEEPTIGIEVGEAIAEVAKKEEENTNIITRILKLLNL